jgi:fermentation-respiration switch protein FrsA (DUF1100 family)
MRYVVLLAPGIALVACQGTPTLSACTDFDCSGHGKCVLVSTEKGARPSCVCDQGYAPSASGWLCLPRTDGSLCAGVSCSGHGVCASVQGKARCVCEAGFATGADGKSCVAPCTGVTCSGHGLCAVDSGGRARCGCDQGYRASSDGLACEAAPLPAATVVTWVATSASEPDSGSYGRVSLDTSEQGSGRLVETESVSMWVVGGKRRTVYTLDPSGSEVASLSFDAAAAEGKVSRRRAGQATYHKDKVELAYQRGGKLAKVSLPIAGAAPLPMHGGYQHPGWTLGCFSPVFYALALRRYDAVKKGTQLIDALVPEAGLLTRVKVAAAPSWTDAKPVLDFPDLQLQVAYQNALPLTIALLGEDAVWTQKPTTPSDLNLEELAPGTPYTPAAPPAGAIESTVALSSADGTALAGTLAMPAVASASAPAVLFVSDAQAADRDTPFAKLPAAPLARHLALHLAAAGFASLRYDPRGRGKSGGELAKLTLAAELEDAAAALAKLAASPGVDPARIFVASLGTGSLAAVGLLGKSAPKPRGYLAIAPAVKGLDQVIVYAETAHMKAAGLPSYYINQHVKKPLEDELKALAAGAYGGGEWRGLPAALWKEILAFDGSAALGAFAGPVLALRGAEDLEVPPEQLQAAQDAATKAGKKNLAAQTLTGLSYLLSEGKMADLWESALLPFELAPAALSAITTWLSQS